MFEINTIFLYKFGWIMNHFCKEYPWVFHAPDRIHPDFPIDTLEYLLNEEVEFENYKYQYKNDLTCFRNIANIKLSVQQNRDKI